MERRRVILMVSLMLFVGCQRDPWADGFITFRLPDMYVDGTYFIDADSQKRIIKLRHGDGIFPIDHSAHITLSIDHKAQFFRVPEEDHYGAACSVTGKGAWHFGRNGNYTVIIARIVNEETNSLCKGDFAYQLMLYGKESPYKLHITIGDPDSGDAVQFEHERYIL